MFFIAVDAELADFEDFFERLCSVGDVDLKQSASGDCAVVIEELRRAEDDTFFAVDAELVDFEIFFPHTSCNLLLAFQDGSSSTYPCLC